MTSSVPGTKTFTSDLLASVVVFLVALPLCMGIALASGVSPERGLITGIVGGLVVGVLAGSPLQVSGPAAGLVVIVWQVVEKFGLDGLGAAVVMAGILQMLAGAVGLGQIFRAVSPTVIHGMLSGIGVLILVSQFHVMFDAKPASSGIENLMSVPARVTNTLTDGEGSASRLAGFISLLTIAVILLWDRFKPGPLKLIPAALIAVFSGTFAANYLGFSIRFVDLPESLLGSITFISYEGFNKLFSIEGLITVLSLAVVASAETLLCAAALDKLHSGPRTRFDKELIAQGIGNTLCGVVAALPMTGVIVRSSANLQSGAKTRMSAILHGGWLLALATLVPGVLRLIPTASLAALLVVTGWKLINFKLIPQLAKRGWEEVLIFALTVGSIVSIDLLSGILIGFGATLVQLIIRLTHFEANLKSMAGGRDFELELAGAATFLRLPKLARALESAPNDATVHVHLHNLSFIDQACLELITAWGDQRQKSGGKVYLEWDALHHYATQKRPVLPNGQRALSNGSSQGVIV